jgi:hypothetical protein
MEGQAQFVGEYAALYHKLTKGGGLKDADDVAKFERMQAIMKESGYGYTVAARTGVDADGNPIKPK